MRLVNKWRLFVQSELSHRRVSYYAVSGSNVKIWVWKSDKIVCLILLLLCDFLKHGISQGKYRTVAELHVTCVKVMTLSRILILGRRKPTRCHTMFIELVISSTCFGHVYTHHQELATVLVVWHVACNSWFLVVERSGAEQQALPPMWGMLCDSSRTASLTQDA